MAAGGWARRSFSAAVAAVVCTLSASAFVTAAQQTQHNPRGLQHQLPDAALDGGGATAEIFQGSCFLSSFVGCQTCSEQSNCAWCTLTVPPSSSFGQMFPLKGICVGSAGVKEKQAACDSAASLLTTEEEDLEGRLTFTASHEENCTDGEFMKTAFDNISSVVIISNSDNLTRSAMPTTTDTKGPFDHRKLRSTGDSVFLSKQTAIHPLSESPGAILTETKSGEANDAQWNYLYFLEKFKGDKTDSVDTSVSYDMPYRASDESNCDRLLSCKQCYEAADAPSGGCQWCMPEITTTASDRVQGFPEMTINILGRCVAKTESCANQKFGEMDSIASAKSSYVGRVSYAVKSIDHGSEACDTVQWPSEVWKYPDCKSCTTADGFGWCKMMWLIRYDGYAVLGIGQGGICIRDQLAHLCNKDLISPSLASLPTIVKTDSGQKIGGSVLIQTQFIRFEDHCPFLLPELPPWPRGECRANLSCKGCLDQSNDCTWCGGVFNFKAMTEGGKNVHLPFLGRCTEKQKGGADTSCADLPNVHSLLDISKEDTGGLWSSEFSVEGFDKSIKPDWCRTVEWPATPFDNPTCEECTASPSGLFGWCRVEMEVSSASAVAGAVIEKSGGICLATPLKFLCNKDFLNKFVKDITVTSASFITKENAHECTTTTTTTTSTVTTTSTTTTTPTTLCSHHESCSQCSAQGCVWCLPVISISEGSLSDHKTLSTPGVLGACVDTADECKEVKFGNRLDAYGFSSADLGNVAEIDVTVRPYFPTDDCKEYCTDVNVSKKSRELDTCQKCVENSLKWCRTETNIAGIGRKSGGACLDAPLQPTCSSFTPNIPGDFPLRLDVKGSLVDAPSKCARPPITGDNDCRKNTSCQTCQATENCGWCSVVVDIDTKEVKDGRMPLGRGACFNLSSLAVDCANLKVPSLEDFFKKTSDASGENKINMQTMPLTKDDPTSNLWCTSQTAFPSPTLEFEDCRRCVRRGQHQWCKLTMNEQEGGVCWPKGDKCEDMNLMEWSDEVVGKLFVSSVDRCPSAALSRHTWRVSALVIVVVVALGLSI